MRETKAAAFGVQQSLVAETFSSRSLGESRRGRGDDPVSFLGRGSDERGPSAPSSLHEQKALTLYRFNSKIGEVSVQPVIGSFKGAQFSLAF